MPDKYFSRRTTGISCYYKQLEKCTKQILFCKEAYGVLKDRTYLSLAGVSYFQKGPLFIDRKAPRGIFLPMTPKKRKVVNLARLEYRWS
jgi:hypothetical protein